MKKINILLSQLSKYKEAFSTWKYRVPKDKEQQLYDFYVLMSLNRSAITDDNLAVAYDEAMETIVNYLYPELLEAVFFAICCEFAHVFDLNSDGDIQSVVEEHYTNISYGQMGKFLDSYSSSTTRTKIDSNLDYKKSDKSHILSYKKVLWGLKNSSLSKIDFIHISALCFKFLNWDFYYGGKNWEMISRGWIRAIGAIDKSISQKAMMIDHLYSLQHNTGVVLDKLHSYYKGGGHYWLKVALDKKFSVKNTALELWEYTSLGLRSFIAATYKNITGDAITKKIIRKQSGYALLEPIEKIKELFMDKNIIQFNPVPPNSNKRFYDIPLSSYLIKHKHEHLTPIPISLLFNYLKKYYEVETTSSLPDELLFFYKLDDTEDTQKTIPSLHLTEDGDEKKFHVYANFDSMEKIL